MKNRSITLLLLAGCLTLAPLSAHAGIFDFLKRKKKPAKTEKPVEKTPYERILTSGKIVSDRQGVPHSCYPLLYLQPSAGDGRLQERQPHPHALRSEG